MGEWDWRGLSEGDGEEEMDGEGTGSGPDFINPLGLTSAPKRKNSHSSPIRKDMEGYSSGSDLERLALLC